jgi:hypothetical protein
MGAASYRVDPGIRTSLTVPIELSAAREAEPGWQQQLRDAVRDVAELERLLELPAGSLPQRRTDAFPLLVP